MTGSMATKVQVTNDDKASFKCLTPRMYAHTQSVCQERMRSLANYLDLF